MPHHQPRRILRSTSMNSGRIQAYPTGIDDGESCLTKLVPHYTTDFLTMSGSVLTLSGMNMRVRVHIDYTIYIL